MHSGDANLYVYSAYLLGGLPRKFRILAMVRDDPPTLMCQIWYRRDVDVMHPSHATIKHLPEGKSRRYISAYIHCDNPSIEETPYALSVSYSSCGQAANVMPVEVLSLLPNLGSLSKSKEISVGLCVTPLNLNYDKVDQILEYLEVGRVFGAKHVTFYNYSCNAQVSTILQPYIVKSYFLLFGFLSPTDDKVYLDKSWNECLGVNFNQKYGCDYH